jgi:dihydroneopterin aldolase
MMDEIFLEGMRFYAYHGVNPEERVQGQRFTVDLVIEADTHIAGETDDLTKTVNYSRVYDVVRGIVEGEPKKLIEAVAEKIASVVLDQFSLAQAVTVAVRKPEVAIKGAILDASGVRIRRSRDASGRA